MIADRDFLENKKRTLVKLGQAKKEGLVDSGIIPILDLINSSEDYYTSSSCYGRIVVLEIPEIGDKKNARWLGKWHDEVKQEDVSDAFKKASKGQLWILAQAPIIHIYARTQSAADNILKTAVSCGFKHSGFKSVEKNIIVEVTSTERLDAPIGKNGSIFCKDEHLSMLVDIANDVIEKSSAKLKRFEENLKK